MPDIDELASPAAEARPLRSEERRSETVDYALAAQKTPKPTRIGWIVLAVAVAGVIWYFRAHPAASREPAGRGGDIPVPVVSGTVTMQDVPIYLDGNGTVQAFNTVAVRSRVDGQLTKIAFTEGQDVQEGDVLAIVDPAPFQTALDQAIGKKGQDAAQLANAQLDLTRDTDLLARKVISSQVYDTQKALVDQLQATVASDEAAIASAKVQLGYTSITAPLSGRVGIRQIDQGNIIYASGTNGLVSITQLQPISMVFTLPEQNLAQIHKQSSDGAGMAVLAMGRDDNTLLDSGTLAVIDNEIDTTTGTIRLKATFPNAHHQLWPGAFVNARLLLTTHKNGVVVPASVVQRGPDGAYAYVITPEQKAHIRTIKVSQIEGGLALIEDGLKPGEIVVVDGQYKLQDGSNVKLAEAGSAQDAGTPGAQAGASPGGHHAHAHDHVTPASSI